MERRPTLRQSAGASASGLESRLDRAQQPRGNVTGRNTEECSVIEDGDVPRMWRNHGKRAACDETVSLLVPKFNHPHPSAAVDQRSEMRSPIFLFQSLERNGVRLL